MGAQGEVGDLGGEGQRAGAEGGLVDEGLDEEEGGAGGEGEVRYTEQ